MFLNDVLYRLALAGATVVLHAPGHRLQTLLFSPEGVFSADSPKAFTAELSKPDTWCVSSPT